VKVIVLGERNLKGCCQNSGNQILRRSFSCIRKKKRVQPYGLCIDLVFFWYIFKEEGFEETVAELEVAVCAERKCE